MLGGLVLISGVALAIFKANSSRLSGTPALKARLQAALILKFSAASLPELDDVLKSAESCPAPSVNGAVPHRSSETASSLR